MVDTLAQVAGDLASEHGQLAAEHRRAKEESEERFRRIEMGQLEGTEKLNTLIKIVDEMVRNRPPNPPAA